ncbi:MAG: hypothetical protein WD534_18575 [Phycisphaeraceae bacterium]
MRTRRIELEGSAGHVAIEREPGSTIIRIDAIVRDPAPGAGQQAWQIWQIAARTGGDDLFKLAQAIHHSVEGHAGTNSDVHGYLVELHRFVD